MTSKFEAIDTGAIHGLSNIYYGGYNVTGTVLYGSITENFVFNTPYATIADFGYLNVERKGTINSQTTMKIRSPSGRYKSYWPSGWGGGIETWDITCASIWTSAGQVATSDIRVKNNINEIPSSLNLVTKLRPVTYYWNKEYEPYRHKELQYGFIAQEIEKIYPDLVIPGPVNENDKEEPFKGVNYTGFIPILTKAVQEQQQQIESQQKTIESLEARLKALEDLLK